jgi:hypothetical protein
VRRGWKRGGEVRGGKGSSSPFIGQRRKGRGRGEAVGEARWPAAMNGLEALCGGEIKGKRWWRGACSTRL